MSRTNRLESIKTLAKGDEAEKIRHVSNRRASLDVEEHRLAQLRVYLNEYQELLAAGTDQLMMTSVRSRRRFVERLREGVVQQEGLVTRLRNEMETHVRHWREARSRSLALEKFSERLEDREDQRQARKEQADLDEVGRNQFLRQDS